MRAGDPQDIEMDDQPSRLQRLADNLNFCSTACRVGYFTVAALTVVMVLTAQSACEHLPSITTLQACAPDVLHETLVNAGTKSMVLVAGLGITSLVTKIGAQVCESIETQRLRHR